MVRRTLVWERRIDNNLICMRHEKSLFSFQSFDEIVFVRFKHEDEAEKLAIAMKKCLKDKSIEKHSIPTTEDKKIKVQQKNNAAWRLNKNNIKKICNKVLPKDIQLKIPECEEDYKYKSWNIESDTSASAEIKRSTYSLYKLENAKSERKFEQYKLYEYRAYDMYFCDGYTFREGIRIILTLLKSCQIFQIYSDSFCKSISIFIL